MNIMVVPVHVPCRRQSWGGPEACGWEAPPPSSLWGTGLQLSRGRGSAPARPLSQGHRPAPACWGPNTRLEGWASPTAPTWAWLLSETHPAPGAAAYPALLPGLPVPRGLHGGWGVPSLAPPPLPPPCAPLPTVKRTTSVHAQPPGPTRACPWAVQHSLSGEGHLGFPALHHDQGGSRRWPCR